MIRSNELLERHAVYDSNNSEMVVMPPFTEFVYLVLNSWEDRDGDLNAKILILSSGDTKMYQEGSVHHINPAFWLWTSGTRIA